MHSFQALIWNKIASRRIKELGLNVVAGDLVLCDDKTEPSAVVDDDVEGCEEDLNIPEEG